MDEGDLARKALAAGFRIDLDCGVHVASVRPVMVLDDPESMARAAATGAGIAMLPLPHALPLLEGGTLVRVLREWYAETHPLCIYYTSRKLVPAKVRVFVDFIVQALQSTGQAARIGQR